MRTHLQTFLLIGIIVAIGLALWKLERMPVLINSAIHTAVRKEIGTMLEAEWVDRNGITRRVKTTKGEPGSENENEEQFQDRHDERVEEQLARYPLP